jgi:hypothetical protein
MGRKYEIALEGLAMLRKDHAVLRRETKESKLWRTAGPAAREAVERVEKESDSLRQVGRRAGGLGRSDVSGASSSAARWLRVA